PLNAPFPHEPVVARLHWEVASERAAVGRFPFAIGADVLYEPASFRALAETARDVLEPGGALFLADPQRKVGRGIREHLEREGLVLEERSDAGGGVIVQCWRLR